MTTLFQFFGRTHPLLLHLPIGFLVLAWLMHWMSRKEAYRSLAPAVGFSLKVGMWSALFAAVSGYVLSLEGGYEESLLNNHKWLGIGTAVLSVVVYWVHRQELLSSKKFFWLLSALVGLIGAAGHFGGSLTHGNDFLTAPFSGDVAKEEKAIENLDEAIVFADFIEPIFKKKCNSCHNESKQKGKLLLTTQDGMLKGGETGPLFIAGDAKASLMMKRIHLPLEEKEHMPPKGKKQLTENEIELMKWWIEGGGVFDQKVAEVKRSEKVEAILASYLVSEKTIFNLKVEPAAEKAIQKLRASGASVKLLAEDQPFISVDLNDRQDVSASLLKQLQAVAPQLAQLNLGNTNLDDGMMSYLNDLPHLQKLDLHQTQLSGTGLEALEGMAYLEYLNLYECPIDDAALEVVSKLPALKRLFLWRTKVSKAAIAELRNQAPRLDVNSGADEAVFGSAKLKPPLVEADKDVFTDSLEVRFSINFKDVNLYYTLDGSIPDSTSTKYEAPIVIRETADIQVIAKKEGWETSEPARRFFAFAKYQARKVTLRKQPSERYAGEGGNTLIDFKKGTTAFTEGSWLGFEKEHFSAVFDLGELVDVSRVSVSALESTSSYIFYPKGLQVAVSKDGRKYDQVVNASYPTAPGPQPPELKNFSESFQTQTARYLRVEVKSKLVNPPWHPAPGAPCWLFLDEIVIE